MWTLTAIGFFSVVQKTGTTGLTVRARVAEDLAALRSRYLPGLSATQSHAGTDYPFRARCTHAAWADALGRMAHDIDYANFKGAVAARQGPDRAHVYSEVWTALRKLEAPVRAAPKPASGKSRSYGGVVMRADGSMLLRKVRGGFDGEGWTWSKGGAKPNESPEQAARREVYEETGVVAEIVCPIPGEHHGTTTINRYWLMRSLDETGAFGADETEAIAWVTPEEARIRIQTTTKSQTKVQRDLAVLEAACAAFASLP